MPGRPLTRRAVSMKYQSVDEQNKDVLSARPKRRADLSPLKNDKTKRSALGNLTNNVHLNNQKKSQIDTKDSNFNAIDKNVVNHYTNTHTTEKCKKAPIKNDTITINNENPTLPCVSGVALRPLTRAAAKNAQAATKVTSILDGLQTNAVGGKAIAVAATIKEVSNETKQDLVTTTKAKEKAVIENSRPTTRRISNEFEKTEESIYVSASEELSSTDSLRLSFAANKRRSYQQNSLSTDSSRYSLASIDEDSGDLSNRIKTPTPIKYPRGPVPEGVYDFDGQTFTDLFQVSEYAMDIFEYLKQREAQFPIDDYMPNQVHLTKWMRSLLVDWMVEVQETFELNHETLYLAVKLVDIYLGKTIVNKEKLQLLGAGALFIACKFDERTPPLVQDFLYICDGAYDHSELIKMEMDILKSVDFDLGIPLSYRFLRRYARCGRVPMPTLTLARYILEYSLMDYSTIGFSDSQMACAVLFMALRMTGLHNQWNSTLEYYSGYKLDDFAYIVPILNAGLHRKPKDTIKTIRNKYSHKIFFEVAKIPLMSNENFFENTGYMIKQL